MGRPKKTETDGIPTKERLLTTALELFAAKGYDAVSVREITRTLHLNEATLYIHYKNKEALLDAILERLEQNLISPTLKTPPPEIFQDDDHFNLAERLIRGGRQFFEKADRMVQLTWRMLMINQYKFEPARRSLEEQILNAPVRFFSGMLKSMQAAEKIGPDIDCDCAGRIIASIFFEYSFRSNLNAAWDKNSSLEYSQLEANLSFFCRSIQK